MFCFKRKNDAPQSASTCEGIYVEDASRGTVNGKPVYVNEYKSTFLAAHPNSGWCITHSCYWDEVTGKQGTFGGFHFGGGTTPVNGSWKAYNVTEKRGFIFTSIPAQDKYADCDGFYVLDDTRGEVNGKSVFVNHAKNKFLAALPNSGWCITNLGDFNNTSLMQRLFEGFHSVDSSDSDIERWTSNNVSKFGPIDEALYEESAWEKLEDTNVSYRSVEKSGTVRTEKDFEAARKHCILIDCGGFSYRKPHYNQFGEEDVPPVCIYFRKTQDELRQATNDSTDYDFYIAPKEFTPDTSFKPYRDPAPFTHVWWTIDKPVYAFACQVVVPEPTTYTYYCMGGYHGCGYGGIQQHSGAEKRILFSVWNDNKADAKVENIYSRPDMTAQAFGGQGMGMQCFGISRDPSTSKDCPLAAWQPGVPYTFVVRAYSVKDATEYESYFYNPDYGWQILARFRRPDTDLKLRGKLRGLYSFIQDFGKNTLRRSVKYAGWIQYDREGAWEPVRHITGTSDAESSEPNKSVRLVSEGSYQVVEIVTGGEALDDYSLYKGPVDNPLPVPDILGDLP